MSAATLPLVSIVILNYKRREALIRCLDAARAQRYPHCELIVVDNGSDDAIADFLSPFAPEVRLIELTSNRGACGGRNAGIVASAGEIIVMLDNDIVFEGSDEVAKIVSAFESRPDVHVLACQLCDERTGRLRVREWCHPRSWLEHADNEFDTNYFIEGACAIRRHVFEATGLYYEPLFIGCEGWDLAVRILDNNFRILHTPGIRLRHLMSAETRTPERPYYFYTRNYIWIAFKDYPPSARFTFLAWKLLMMLYFSIRSRKLRTYLNGIRDGIRGLRRIRAERTPMSKHTVRRLAEFERERPPLWTRVLRHREEVQL